MTIEFFASVRRNQRQWMVVLTILSIFAFLFDDVARGANNLTSNSTALFIAVLCAGVMSILGYPRGHTVMYGLIGFVAGGGAALIGSTFGGNKPLVRTTVGNLGLSELRDLQTRRHKVQRFFDSCSRRAQLQRVYFGETSETQMVGFAIMEREARRLGVTLSDDAVSEFIKRSIQEKLSEADYIGALKDAGVGETELFDLVRGELEVQLLDRLMKPSMKHPYEFAPHISEALLTPLQLWDHFKKLHVHEKLTSVAVPVTEFVKLVPAPAESELRAFFDKYKTRFGDEFGNPGFLESPKMKLAYLMAADLEAYEKGLPDATDQEVADYYIEHMNEFRTFQLPDSMTIPELKKDVDSAEPADASSPANVAIEPPATQKADETEKKSESNPPVPEKKDEAKPDPETKKPNEAPESPKKDAAGGGDADSDETQFDKDEEKKPQPAETDSPKPAPESQTEKVPPAPAAPSGDEPPIPLGGNFPKLPGVQIGRPNLPDGVKFPAPRFRELNDEVKLEIREKLLKVKALERMSEVVDEAAKYMETLELAYGEQETGRRAAFAAGLPEKLKDYAAKHKLEYHETKEMTFRELSGPDSIGSAFAGTSKSRDRTVADEVFAQDPSGRGYVLALYATRRAHTSSAQYAYWKIEEIPAKIPDLKDEATRQLAEDAFKFDKARELAHKRARELVELVKKGEADIPAALTGQTINGTAESPAATVHETPSFTWLRVSSSIPSMGGLPRAMISFVPEIQQPGNGFMKAVFEELQDGETGVALNEPRTVFYVVRVHDRETSTTADGGIALQKLQFQFMNEQFGGYPPTTYDFVAMQMGNGIDAMWRQNFNQRYGIKFENIDIRARVADGSDE